MTELNKLFVRVPGNQTVLDISTVSMRDENVKKLYFIEKLNTIVTKGVAYGVDPGTLEKLDKLINVVGQTELDTTDVSANTIVQRLQTLEGIHVNTADSSYATITIDPAGKGSPELDLNVVGIDAGLQGLVDAINAKTYIDREVAKATSKVAVGTGLKLDKSANADNSSTYTISPDFELAYHSAENNTPAYITIEKDSSTFGTINVSDIIGNGVLKNTSYNQTTGILSLTFATASGQDKTEDVNLGQLLDLDDFVINTNSSIYLKTTLPENPGDSSQLLLEVLLQDPSTATAQSTGLTDAWKVKQYVDSKSSDLTVAVTSRNAYIDASVGTGDDNKHVYLEAQTANVTISEGTRGTYSESDAGVSTSSGFVAPNISGTANKLLDAADAMEAVKKYVDAKVSEEELRTNSVVRAAVKSLDSEENGTGTNVTVDVSIVDGKLADVAVTENYATVQVVRTADSPADPKATTFTVTDGTKLVVGDDLIKLKNYTDDKIEESTAALNVTVTGDNYINAAVPANDNKHIDVSADVQTLTVTQGTAGTYDNVTGAESTAPTHGNLTGVANSLVDGSDVATKVKDYVDGEVAIETARTDAAIKQAITALDSSLNSTGSTNVLVDASITDGKLTKLNVTEHYAEITGTRRNTGTHTDANFVITSGDEGKMVVASDLVTLKNYVDDEIAANTDDLQVNGETNDPAYITLTQKTGDNKTLVVDVSINDLTFTQGSGSTDSALTGTANSFADGADVATKVSSFTNARIREEIAKLDTSVSKKDTKQYIEVNTVQTDGSLSDQNVTTTYGTYGATATLDSSGVATVEDTRAFVDTYDFWETYNG